MRTLPTRRHTAAAAIAAAALATAGSLAGCGSSSSSSSSSSAAKAAAPPSPTATALSYFPSTAPGIAVVGTSPTSATGQQLKQAQAQVPAIALGKAALFQEMAKAGIDYNRDVKPLLGNPVALGALAVKTGPGQTPFLAAWQTSSATALQRLITSIKGLTKAGSHDGATLYTQGGATVAVKGPMLLLSESTAQVDAALDRHDAGGGFSADDYAKDLAGVSPNGLITLVGNVADAIASDPQAAKARQIPWVAALSGYGASLSLGAHALTMQVHARTDGRQLTDSQLPMAAGATAPGLAGVLPIAVGLRDPAQVWTFVKAVMPLVKPSAAAKLARGETRAKREGIDIEKLISQFDGDLAVTSDQHTTLARAQVADPAYVSATLKQLAAHPTDPIDGGKPDRYTPLGGGLYRVANHGSATDVQTIGVVGHSFVLGERATARQLRAYASAPAQAQSGAAGAFVFRLALPALIALSGKTSDNPVAQQLLSKLGDLTGSVQATTSGMTGSASLAIK